MDSSELYSSDSNNTDGFDATEDRYNPNHHIQEVLQDPFRWLLPHSVPTWNPTDLDLAGSNLQVGPGKGSFMYVSTVHPST